LTCSCFFVPFFANKIPYILIHTFMAIFIVTFRETLEAAIIIGLIFSMLKTFGAQEKSKTYIFLGIVAWIVMSFFFAAGFQYFFGWFEWTVEKVYEWVLMILACAMITQFLVWTNANFKNIWKKLKKSIEHIITIKQLWMLSILVFASVVREWVETVIFLNALNFSFAWADIWLALLGIVGAVIVSYILFFSIQKINISKVLRATNAIFILVAGWLLAHGIVEFQWAWFLPTFMKPLFDLSGVLSEKTWLWAILKAALSYDANPSLLAFTAYLSYIIWFWYYFFGRKSIK